MKIVAIAVGCLAVAVAQAAPPSSQPWTRLTDISGGGTGRIVFDPKDPRWVLAGTTGGQIALSTNGGATWMMLPLAGINEEVRAIAFDPANSKTVFAATTSEEDGGVSGGVYRSLDRGLHWTRLAHQPTGGSGTTAGFARGLELDPAGKILVLTDKRQGVFKSADLGQTWSNPLPGDHIYGIATDPNNPAGLWVGGLDFAQAGLGTVWHSTDFGSSWTALPVTILDPNLTPTPYSISVALGTGMLAVNYSGFDPNTGAPAGGAFYSTTGGASWSFSTGLPAGFNPGNTLVRDPVNSSTLYMGDNDDPYPNSLFRSTDGGITWQSIGAATSENGEFTVAARPTGPGIAGALFAGGYGILASTDHGQSWQRSDAGFLQGAAFDIHNEGIPKNGFYAADLDGLYHTPDLGRTWQRISTWPGLKAPTAIAVSPSRPHPQIYASTGAKLWGSATVGASWYDATPLAAGEQGGSLATDPSQVGSVYYLATSSAEGLVVYASTTAGAHWRRAVIDSSGGFQLGVYGVYWLSPTQMLLDPARPGVLYALSTNGLWRSQDHGATWTETFAGPALDMALTPGSSTAPSKLYLETLVFNADGSTTTSLFASTNGGTTLTPVTTPFGSDPFRLVAAPAGNRLFASDLFGGPSVQRSTDGAQSWSEVAAAIADQFNAGVALQLIPTGSGLFATSTSGASLMFYAPYAGLPH